jgi:hypothetical protein
LTGSWKWEPSFTENLSATAPRVTLQPIPGCYQVYTAKNNKLAMWDG